MFKYICIALLAISTSVAAQQPIKANKNVVCFPGTKLFDDLKDKYGEEPMVMGVEGTMKDVGMALFINKDTGSYTVVEFDSEAACIISIGKNVRYRFPKTGLTS